MSADRQTDKANSAKETTMARTRITAKMLANMDLQVAGVQEEEAKETKGPKIVKSWTDDAGKELGDICEGTFSIKVTKDEKNPETKKVETKVLYHNPAERFEYPRVNSLVNALRHASKTGDVTKFLPMTDEQLEGFGTAIPEEFNVAVARVTRVYNDRLKADAKASAYSALQSKHKPLDEEEKEVAWAKAIRNIVKSSPMSVETVIEMLRGKVIPEDYTVEDYNSTKMRKARGIDEDDDE